MLSAINCMIGIALGALGLDVHTEFLGDGVQGGIKALGKKIRQTNAWKNLGKESVSRLQAVDTDAYVRILRELNQTGIAPLISEKDAKKLKETKDKQIGQLLIKAFADGINKQNFAELLTARSQTYRALSAERQADFAAALESVRSGYIKETFLTGADAVTQATACVIADSIAGRVNKDIEKAFGAYFTQAVTVGGEKHITVHEIAISEDPLRWYKKECPQCGCDDPRDLTCHKGENGAFTLQCTRCGAEYVSLDLSADDILPQLRQIKAGIEEINDTTKRTERGVQKLTEQNEPYNKLLEKGKRALFLASFVEAEKAFRAAEDMEPKRSEAYFGMALAKYKVQYIHDYVHEHEQPVCFVFPEKKFSDGKHYKRACELATPAQREIYRKQAEEIDEIVAQFQNYKDRGYVYDCFICVKVSECVDPHVDLDEYLRGAQTKDCAWVNAPDGLYNFLLRNKYNPFFSEVDCKNKPGVDYEALILYALYSAKCMIVVCSDEEYLITPWVKNEYTRYYRRMKDGDKQRETLCVVYGDRPIELTVDGNELKVQNIARNTERTFDSLRQFLNGALYPTTITSFSAPEVAATVTTQQPKPHRRAQEIAAQKEKLRKAREEKRKEKQDARKKSIAVKQEKLRQQKIQKEEEQEELAAEKEKLRKEQEVRKQRERLLQEIERQRRDEELRRELELLAIEKERQRKEQEVRKAKEQIERQRRDEELRHRREELAAEKARIRKECEVRKAKEKAKRQAQKLNARLIRDAEREKRNENLRYEKERFVANKEKLRKEREIRKRSEQAKRAAEQKARARLAREQKDKQRKEFDIDKLLFWLWGALAWGCAIAVGLYTKITRAVVIGEASGILFIVLCSLIVVFFVVQIVLGIQIGYWLLEECIPIPIVVIVATISFYPCYVFHHMLAWGIICLIGMGVAVFFLSENCADSDEIGLQISVLVIGVVICCALTASYTNINTFDGENSNYYYTINTDDTLTVRAKEYTETVKIPEIIDGKTVTVVASPIHPLGNARVTEVFIPDTVQRIERNAFRDCWNLEKLTLGRNVKEIGNSSFSGCRNLEELKLPETLETIGYAAFHGCSALTNMKIGDNVTALKYKTFSCCYNLRYVKIGKNVTSIGAWAFSYNWNLANVVLSNTIEDISLFAWLYDNDLKNIWLEANEAPKYYKNRFTNGLFWPKQTIFYQYEWEYVDGVPTLKEI